MTSRATSEITSRLAHAPLFEGLPQAALSRIVGLAHPKRLGAGALFFSLLPATNAISPVPDWPLGILFGILGIGVATWSALYVIGVPIGAYLSAKDLNEYKLTAPKDPSELVRVFLGGMVMGFGAATAGG